MPISRLFGFMNFKSYLVLMKSPQTRVQKIVVALKNELQSPTLNAVKKIHIMEKIKLLTDLTFGKRK